MATSNVLVLWDHATNRPRGETHALDCHMVTSSAWAEAGYIEKDGADVPEETGRCGFCGGGRAEPDHGTLLLEINGLNEMLADESQPENIRAASASRLRVLTGAKLHPR